MIESLLVAIPKNIVPRETSPEMEKFERITGIKKTRRYDKLTIEMIKSAADHLKVVEVPDHLIVVTQSPSYLSPCMAVAVADHLRFPSRVISFDVNHACDGWVLGCHLAMRLGGRTMLICADRLRYEPNNLEKYIFSDSVSITELKSTHLTFFKSYTDGSQSDKLYCGLDGTMRMVGGDVFDFVTTKVPELINSCVKDFGAFDFLIPHQANLSMLKILEKRSGFENRTLYSIEEYGNQSMNSIPTCLAMHHRRITGKRILHVGFGAGFTASAISIWGPKNHPRIVEIA